MENNQIVIPENGRETEEFFAIIEDCTQVQKTYLAGVLDGMSLNRRLSEATQRTA